jgi:phosphoglucomutase
MISPLAGHLPTAEMLVNVDRLLREYFQRKPDMSDPRQRVKFGTSGHRGTPDEGSFTESHILAISQAICDYRKSKGINGPLFLAKDTHAVDGAAHETAMEVLAANGVETIIAANDDFTAVPVLSHAILTYNRCRKSGFADGIAITPSHNPPRDGGFKYNPPSGGPADIEVTQWVESLSNALLRSGNRDVKRVSHERALAASTTHRRDLAGPYIEGLADVVDMDAIRASGLRIGADPLGGASVHLWYPIRERYKIDVTEINPSVDYTFRFMNTDHDGEIRMDPSSPYAMAGLIEFKNKFQLAFGNDPDADRHGIVAPSIGLIPPNHNLAVSIRYLFTNRPRWPITAMVGKTVVTSSIIDKVAGSLKRKLYEVPVGFKWFVPGLFDGSLGFAGEESAGATFLKKDGSVWTTDKDGLVMDLLACEIAARTAKDTGENYDEIEQNFGHSYSRREDEPATLNQKRSLEHLNPSSVRHSSIAGDAIIAVLTRAPGNEAPIDGLKVETANGWFAARPSGTEAVYKIYAESFKSDVHLAQILLEARDV